MTFRTAIAALLIATAVPAAALAQDVRPTLGAGHDDQDQARAAVREGRRIPLSRVIPEIAARTPGRMLNVTTGDQGGRPAYFVQWQQTNGRVVVFVVDAETGAILGRQGG
jgi:uncharacterized membrane protein YkoI